MLNQSRLPICRLSDIIKPVTRKFLGMVPGPKSPLERNPQTPKGWKTRESDGVGLAIVVALETKDKFVASPVSVIGSSREEFRCKWRFHEKEEEEEEEEKEESVGPFRGPGDDDDDGVAQELDDFRPADFLRCCYLCRKKLDGKDIFIYRGDRAFCSMECRYQHIVSEEFQEKCGAELLRSSENIAKPSRADDRLFFMVAAS